MNNITSSSSSNSAYMPVADNQKDAPPGTVKSESIWSKTVNLQQALSSAVISLVQDLYNRTFSKYSQCAGGIVASIHSAAQRTIRLFDVKRQGVQHQEEELPNWGLTEMMEAGCEYYHVISIIYPANITLFHAVIKNKVLSVLEYSVGQMAGLAARSFRAAKLLGDKAGILYFFDNTSKDHRGSTNVTKQFLGSGRYLNAWSESAPTYIPQIEACDITICMLSVTQPHLQQQRKLNDIWFMILPALRGAVVLIGIAGAVYYYKCVQPINDDRRKQLEKDKARQAHQDKIIEMTQKVDEKITGRTFQGSEKYKKREKGEGLYH